MSESESDGSDSSEEEEEDQISQEYLDSLLEKARRSIAAKAVQNTAAHKADALEDDIIELDDPGSDSELKYAFLSLSLFSNSHIVKGDSLRWIQVLCRRFTSHLGKHQKTARQPFGT